MPNWKKIIVSGSDASLNSLNVNHASGSFSGSFQGDGSNLTGITVDAATTVEDSFTSQTSISITHNFETKNIIVSVYNNDDEQIIPETVTTTDNNTVDIVFSTSTSGRVVVVRGGHILSGSAATASLALELSNLATASFALTASHALNVPDTASHALTAVTSSIADELSQLATASFADNATSASYALYAVSASHEIVLETSSSFAETASLAINLSPEATASQADNATTASFAITASHALNVPDTASHALTAVSASIADEISQLATASFALNAESASVAARATTLSSDATASFADRATSASIADELSQLATASIADTAVTASHVVTASHADTAASSSYALTASVALNVPATSSHADRATSASIADEISQLATASIANTAVTASHVVTASFADRASSASIADSSITSSYGLNMTASNLFVEGTASITYLESIYETSSIIYASGSTKFGDDTSDTHEITGSTDISGTLEVVGNIQATGARTIAAQYDSNHYIRLEGNSGGGVLKGADGGVTTIFLRSYGDGYFNAGNLGIGTTSPESILEIAKSDQTNGAVLSITNAFQGSDWTAGDIIGGIDFRIDDTSTTEPIRGQIKLIDGLSTSNTYPYSNDMVFSTAYFNDLIERMRIDANAISGSVPFSGSFVGDGSGLTGISVSGGSGSFSGSFEGDGSGLTGITVDASTLVNATFTSQTSLTASHDLDSTNLIITVLNNNNEVLIPENIRILDSSNVGFDFATSTSGKYVLAKGGHIVSGSIASASIADVATLSRGGSGSFSGSFEGDGTNLTGVASPTGSYTGSFTGSMLVSDHILPTSDEVYDLGSPDKKFRDLYLSSSTLYLGDSKISVHPIHGGIQVTNTQTGTPAASLLSGSFSGSFSGSYSGSGNLVYENITVTVVNDGGNKYAFNGITAPYLSIQRPSLYRFDLSDSTNIGHPFAFRLPDNTSYTTGVTTVGTAGTVGAYVELDVDFNSSSSLKYYCTVHGNGMGNNIQVNDLFNLSTSGSFSGSFEGDGSNLTGIDNINSSSVAARATTLSSAATASIADRATTSSQADSTTSASIADELSQLATASHADTAVTASFAINFNPLATASFAITASHALNGGGGGGSIVEETTVSDTFTNVSSKQIVHNFGTKNVFVQTYYNDDTLFFPESVTTTDVNTVDITFTSPSTGRVIIGKSGHLVTASAAVESIAADSFTNQTSYTASHNFGTKEVVVQVYDNNDNVIVPSNIRAVTDNAIGLDFASSRTGKVIISKGGHIVTGSVIATASVANSLSPSGQRQSVVLATSDFTGSFYSLHIISSSLSMSAPPSPQPGDWFKVSQRVPSGSNFTSSLLFGNGSQIMSASTELELDVEDQGLEFIYADQTQGWVLIGN